MSKSQKEISGVYNSVGPRVANTYHGRHIPEPQGESRFSARELKRAVTVAAEKYREREHLPKRK